MSLRYKGKPDLNKNRQADELWELCFCKFVCVGEPMDSRSCKAHTDRAYPCGECKGCTDYRPNAIKKAPNHWPSCVCGHIAQEHN